MWAGLNNCTSEPMYVDAAKAVYNFSKDQVFKMESTVKNIFSLFNIIDIRDPLEKEF